MKQYITKEQLNELGDKEKGKLRKWWKPKMGDLNQHSYVIIINWDDQSFVETNDLPLLSIGQMIELLGDGWWFNCNSQAGVNQLCDSLWEAVKEQLKQYENT